MDSAKHICTHCGYEGKPVRPPSDETYAGQSDASKAIMRVANLVFPGAGLIIRPLAMFLMVPIYMVLWPIKRMVNGPKHCSNCGLPLMVKKSSDAGFIAMRKQELKEGKRFDRPEAPKLAFGKDIALPGDEKEPVKPALQRDKLPSLEVLLQDAPAPAAPAAEQVEEQPKKTVDPDQW